MKQEDQAKEFANFLTVTCLEWRHVLSDNRFKDIIAESLSFLYQSKRVSVYAFVIMSNHFHLIWQMLGDHRRDEVQRDFLKFTSQQILKILRNENSEIQQKLLVNSADRKYQIWERNPLNIPLWSPTFIEKKLDYIHENPVRAGLCKYPWDYKYSSAGFYYRQETNWIFLSHY